MSYHLLLYKFGLNIFTWGISSCLFVIRKNTLPPLQGMFWVYLEIYISCPYFNRLININAVFLGQSQNKPLKFPILHFFAWLCCLLLVDYLFVGSHEATELRDVLSLGVVTYSADFHVHYLNKPTCNQQSIY